MTGSAPRPSASLAILLICGAIISTLPRIARGQGQPKSVVLVDAVGNPVARRQMAAAIAANRRLQMSPSSPVTRALASPAPAAASEAPTAQIAARLEAADDAIAKFDYDKALIQLFRAERPLIDAVPRSPVRSGLAEINFRLGLIYLQQKDRDRARTAFGAVHFLMPDRELDPARYPPDVVGGFERARPGPPDSTLAVTASVDGAAVFVDGRPAGLAPLEITVPAGVHYVLVRKHSYRPSGRRVETQPGDVEPVRIALGMLPPAVLAGEVRAGLAARTVQILGDVRRSGNRARSLAGSDAAVVIVNVPNSGLIGYGVEDGRITRSYPLPSGASELARDLGPPPAITGIGGTEPPTPWFRRSWVLATFGGAVATASVITFLLLSSGDDMRQSGGICFPPEC